MSSVVALIPARGGSKTIPHKNIMSFHGKPLIAWSIEAAVNSKSISRVITSTDSLDIANIAKTQLPIGRLTQGKIFPPFT